jgi:PKD repeat protein
LTVTSAAGQSWTNIAQYNIDNLPPTITSLSIPAKAIKGSAFKVTVTATDPGAADEAAGLSYTWTFGDNTVVSGANATHSYTNTGTYTITITVADQWGAKTVRKATIVVS